eukprot:1158377-Pelagomonas_calceolata.AAC.5
MQSSVPRVLRGIVFLGWSSYLGASYMSSSIVGAVCADEHHAFLKSNIFLRVEGNLEQVFVLSSSMCSPGISYTTHE